VAVEKSWSKGEGGKSAREEQHRPERHLRSCEERKTCDQERQEGCIVACRSQSKLVQPQRSFPKKPQGNESGISGSLPTQPTSRASKTSSDSGGEDEPLPSPEASSPTPNSSTTTLDRPPLPPSRTSRAFACRPCPSGRGAGLPSSTFQRRHVR
jgi:hypothetical protein